MNNKKSIYLGGGGGGNQLNNRCIYLPINLQLFADNTLNYTKVDNPYEYILNKPTWAKGDIKTKIIYNLVEYYKKIPNYDTITTLPQENVEYIKEALPNVTSCYKMMGYSESHFDDNGCGALTSIDTTGWDTSNVTNMSYMFYGCYNLTNLDVSKWNTSNVNDMSYMFAHCRSLPEETILDVFNNWDTSNVTNMSYMFWKGPRCLSSASLLSNLSNWDTSNVTNMSSMFSFWALSGTVDVSNLDTSNVTNMSNMFGYNKGLSSLDASNWDTSKVTNMNSMFWYCDTLETLDISNWDTSNVTDMSGMFYLTDVNEIPEYGAPLKTIKGVIDMKSCTSYNSMFWGCTNLTSPVKIKNPPPGITATSGISGLAAGKYEIVS